MSARILASGVIAGVASKMMPPRLPQLEEGYTGAFRLQGEYRLWRKVLVLAFRDLNRVGLSGFKEYAKRDVQARAKRWIDCDETYPAGFLWCCSLLDIDPELLRANKHNPALISYFEKVTREPASVPMLREWHWMKTFDRNIKRPRGTNRRTIRLSNRAD